MEIKIQNLSFGYIKKPFSLVNVNALIKEGETVAVMGGDGMGKSSLLKLLCGLEKQYVGFIKIDNQDIKEIKEEKRRISYLPSEPVFLESKTVKDNLLYLFEVEKIQPFKDEKILEIFKEFSLEISLYEKVKKLSLFEKRMLAIIRSYIKNPLLVLIDEQTEGLDEESIIKIKNAITLLINDKNSIKTSIIACNNANMLEVANKCFYISYGALCSYNNISEVEKASIDLFITNYFDKQVKDFMLTKEDNNYYILDYKITYKNLKKKKGEIVEILNKIKLSNAYYDVLSKTQILEDERLDVVFVGGEKIEFSDKIIDKMFKDKTANLYEKQTGVKII